jgi:hypothetical protein
VNGLIKNKKPYLQYDISAGFSQVYLNGTALFKTPQEYKHSPAYREIVTLIEGGLIGAIIPTIIETIKVDTLSNYNAINKANKGLEKAKKR